MLIEISIFSTLSVICGVLGYDVCNTCVFVPAGSFNVSPHDIALFHGSVGGACYSVSCSVPPSGLHACISCLWRVFILGVVRSLVYQCVPFASCFCDPSVGGRWSSCV